MILFVFIWSGAALGPLLAGLLSAGGWDQVFYMLMTADFLALLVSSFIRLIEANISWWTKWSIEQLKSEFVENKTDSEWMLTV